MRTSKTFDTFWVLAWAVYFGWVCMGSLSQAEVHAQYGLDIPQLIENKRLEVEQEQELPVSELAIRLAVAHQYVRSHEKVCDPYKTHAHCWTVYDEDRLSDLILEKACGR